MCSTQDKLLVYPPTLHPTVATCVARPSSEPHYIEYLKLLGPRSEPHYMEYLNLPGFPQAADDEICTHTRTMRISREMLLVWYYIHAYIHTLLLGGLAALC